MPTLQLLPLDDTLIGGRYEIDQVLGSGGVGTVYRATHLWTKREVAVKVLDPTLPHFSQLQDSFLREARATVQLEHPNVVDVLDMGEDGAGTTYMVMELLRGPTLREVLVEQGPLSPEDTAAILLPLIDALEKGHELGLVHKDFKPENIILSVDAFNLMTPKLLDFGIAQIVRESQPRALESVREVIIGTPQYMSPEQARDQRHLIGPQTDVWGVGVVWYECLTGRSPFQGETPLEVLTAVCEAPLDLEGIPENHAQVLQWTMERSASKRIPSLWVLRAELDRAGVFAGSTPAVRGAVSSSLPPATERPSYIRRTKRDAERVARPEPPPPVSRVDSELLTLPTSSSRKAVIPGVALAIAVGFAAWWTIDSWRKQPSTSTSEPVVESAASKLDSPEPAEETSDALASTQSTAATEEVGTEETQQDPSGDTVQNPAEQAAPETEPDTQAEAQQEAREETAEDRATAKSPARPKATTRPRKTRDAPAPPPRQPTRNKNGRVPDLVTDW
jgi:serine/threonine-protein kinase